MHTMPACSYEIYMISQDRFVTTERHRLLHVHEASGKLVPIRELVRCTCT
jgi:hypothetical protein